MMSDPYSGDMENEEWAAWYALSMQERWAESMKLYVICPDCNRFGSASVKCRYCEGSFFIGEKGFKTLGDELKERARHWQRR